MTSYNDIYRIFNDYVERLFLHDAKLEKHLLVHLTSKSRNATERHLYNKKWKHRFTKIITLYIIQIIRYYQLHQKISSNKPSILDFGGGTGIISHFISELLDCSVYVYDINSTSLEICKSRAKYFNNTVSPTDSPPRINFDLMLSFFSIREAHINGANLLHFFSSTSSLIMVDRNDHYIPFRISQKYGLSINEIDKILSEQGFHNVFKSGACIMPKDLGFLEPSFLLNIPLWASPSYISSYTKDQNVF